MLWDMIRITSVAIVLSLLATTTAFAVEPGVYYCVVERVVGIQPAQELKDNEAPRDVPRTWGRIKPAKEKFIVRIVKLDKTLPKYLCEDKQLSPNRALGMDQAFYCSDGSVFEAILPKERKNKGYTALGRSVCAKRGEPHKTMADFPNSSHLFLST